MDQDAIRKLVSEYDYTHHPYASQLKNIAQSIITDSCEIKKGDKELLYFDEPGLPLVAALYHLCIEKGTSVKFFLRDYEQIAKDLTALSLEEIAHYCDEEKELIEEADNIIIIRGPKKPDALNTVETKKKQLYLEKYSEANSARTGGTKEWLLFYWPTEFEATVEGLDYDEYMKEVIVACDEPWEEIYEVQKKLVNILNKGKELTLIADANDPDPNRRTEVHMSIEGMTFINSTIVRNFPGSEVFSAPVKTSVNGQIFAKGRYWYQGSAIMEDILLKIKDGKIIEAHAAKGDDDQQEILSRGEGARYFGEVAFGTNPGLKRRFLNALLNEKVGGSFHMAIGHCYSYTTYRGEEVHLDNGNTEDLTSVHWDVTISMRDNGKVIVDGETIQENGKFLDPHFAVLNG